MVEPGLKDDVTSPMACKQHKITAKVPEPDVIVTHLSIKSNSFACMLAHSLQVYGYAWQTSPEITC